MIKFFWNIVFLVKEKQKHEVAAVKAKQEMSLNHCNNLIILMTAPPTGQNVTYSGLINGKCIKYINTWAKSDDNAVFYFNISCIETKSGKCQV